MHEVTYATDHGQRLLPVDHAAQKATDPTTDFVQLGESRMSDVAERLGVDPNSLLKANPQIANPDWLMPGQEIRLPQAPPPVPLRDAESTSESQIQKNTPNPSLPEQPLGLSALVTLFSGRIRLRTGHPGVIRTWLCCSSRRVLECVQKEVAHES